MLYICSIYEKEGKKGDDPIKVVTYSELQTGGGKPPEYHPTISIKDQQGLWQHYGEPVSGFMQRVMQQHHAEITVPGLPRYLQEQAHRQHLKEGEVVWYKIDYNAVKAMHANLNGGCSRYLAWGLVVVLAIIAVQWAPELAEWVRRTFLPR